MRSPHLLQHALLVLSDRSLLLVPSQLKRRIWNRDFARGRWDHIDHTVGDIVYDVLRRHARGGSILDLGCGSGNTASELDPAAFSAYVGVDVSDVAVDRARRRALAAGLDDRVTYHCSAMEEFEPATTVDVVLFRESLYYVPLQRIPKILARLSAHLAPDGVFVVKLWNGHELAPIVRLIEAEHTVVDRAEAPGTDEVVLVFR